LDIVRRNDRFSVRVQIPADLARRAGRKEIWKSLRTADRSVARRRAALLNLVLTDSWNGLRAAMGGVDDGGEVTGQLRALIETLVATLDAALARYDVTYPVDPKSGPYRQQVRRRSSLLEGQRDYLQASAEEASQQLPALMQTLRGFEERAGRTAAAAAVAGAMTAEILESLNAVISAASGRTIRPPAPPFLEFLEKTYTAEQNLRADAQRHIDGYARLFARILGDKPIGDYSRADVVHWIRTLERMPRTYGKSPRDHKKPIETLMIEAKAKGTFGATTIEKHLMHVRSIFLAANIHHKFATTEEIREELLKSVPLSKTVPRPEKRKSWSPDKLDRLFNSPLWKGTRSRLDDRTHRHQPGPQVHLDAYWWLPIIAIHTGMRLEEIAQLQHDDLRTDAAGLYYIRVHDGGERTVKTGHSIRNVPVHPFLLEIRLQDLFDPSKTGRIWSELKAHGRPPSWGGLYSTHFTDYRKAVGLYENLLDFHSLRRTAITMLRTRCDIDALTVAAIAGHDDSDSELRKLQMTDSYTDYSIAHLHAAIAKLNYEEWEVGLSAIRKAAAEGGPRGSIRVEV
jgi:integrase